MPDSKRKLHTKKGSRRQDYMPYLVFLCLIISILAFIFLCFHYDHIQDDAFISFRYAANFLKGNGLVYNIGERVEGYTNFLWIVMLIFSRKILAIDYLISARFLGVASGVIIYILVYILIARRRENHHLSLFTAAGVLLLSNLSLPYWSISGLETVAFAAAALAALVAEQRYAGLTPVCLILATLLRPEGALVFAATAINRLIIHRRLPLKLIMQYLLPLAPFGLFKLAYYGSLLPNPFFAKSGVGFEYIASGLEYLWHFISTVGVYGIVFVIPLLAVKRLWKNYSLFYLFILVYILYIIWVGGDVLKVYRFWTPIIPPLYFLFVISLWELLSFIGGRFRIIFRLSTSLALVMTLLFAVSSYLMSRPHVNMYLDGERLIVDKMHLTGRRLRTFMGPRFSVAASTIGALGYELVGHRVIDILGLTDQFIARNPEKIEGLSSTWKERRFNSRYLLEQQPDFIIFSINFKPSAPAEKSLILHSEFRRNYRSIGFPQPGMTEWNIVFQRIGPVEMARDVVHPDIAFADNLNAGYGFLSQNKYDTALACFAAARQSLPEEYPDIVYCISDCLYQKNLLDSSLFYLNRALHLDSNCWKAHMLLGIIARSRGDTAEFYRQAAEIARILPWINQSPL